MNYLALLFLPLLLVNPDPPKKCGTDELFQQMLEKDPAFKKAWIENHRQASQGNGLTPGHKHHKRMQMLMNESAMDTLLSQSNDDNITIPVVIHVIAPSADHPANISMAQIQSQIRELNRAFSRDQYPTSQNFPPYWADNYADDSEIRFCLAERDPDGKPTKGVTQTFTSVPSFPYPSSDMKFDATGGKDAWPRSEYLNIWVVVITGGVPLGWATYPLPIYPAGEDGIVIDYRYFGTIEEASTPPFNLGRTCVHEVGHWLGLMHTWGMEGPDFPPCAFDDLVDDTPEQAAPNYGCSPFTTTCDGEIDMLPNYMNYSTDVCNVFFTNGQVKRMRTTLAPGGFRFKLPYSDKGCYFP
ncbi:MAG: zinc metalloprotease [Bacteroidota bacterium]